MIVTLRGIKWYIVVSAILLCFPCPFAWLNRARADFFGSLVYSWDNIGATNLAVDLGILVIAILLLRRLAANVSRRRAMVLFWAIAIFLGWLMCKGRPSVDMLVEWIKYFGMMLILDVLLPSKPRVAVTQPDTSS